jgi:hypothetical protein
MVPLLSSFAVAWALDNVMYTGFAFLIAVVAAVLYVMAAIAPRR